MGKKEAQRGLCPVILMLPSVNLVINRTCEGRCESSMSCLRFRDSFCVEHCCRSQCPHLGLWVLMIFIPGLNAQLVWWAQQYKWQYDWMVNTVILGLDFLSQFLYSLQAQCNSRSIVRNHLFVSTEALNILYQWSLRDLPKPVTWISCEYIKRSFLENLKKLVSVKVQKLMLWHIQYFC